MFRAFFTEFYGRNNDHNSSAWVDRVGGTTVEDYASYWYERHGKWGDYVPPSRDPVGGVDEPPVEDDPVLPPDSALADSLDEAVAGELLVGQALLDPTDVML